MPLPGMHTTGFFLRARGTQGGPWQGGYRQGGPPAGSRCHRGRCHKCRCHRQGGHRQRGYRQGGPTGWKPVPQTGGHSHSNRLLSPPTEVGARGEPGCRPLFVRKPSDRARGIAVRIARGPTLVSALHTPFGGTRAAPIVRSGLRGPLVGLHSIRRAGRPRRNFARAPRQNTFTTEKGRGRQPAPPRRVGKSRAPGDGGLCREAHPVPASETSRRRNVKTGDELC